VGRAVFPNDFGRFPLRNVNDFKLRQVLWGRSIKLAQDVMDLVNVERDRLAG
jgi:hypothetical protein